jgi:hypothetical protein
LPSKFDNNNNNNNMSSSNTVFTFDANLTEPSAIWSNIVGETHMLTLAHLLVKPGDHESVNLEAAGPKFKDPFSTPPENEAHFSFFAKAFQREQDDLVTLKGALLKHMKIVQPNVYTDCITKCGGPEHLHKLKVYHITKILRAEIEATDEGSQVATLARLTAEAISFSDDSPLRALESRILLIIIELGRTEYELPRADLLRRIRAIFNVYCPTNNQLQIAYTEYHNQSTAEAPPTGTGLLKHMTKLEKTVRAQGGEIFPQTLGTQNYAYKATNQAHSGKAHASQIDDPIAYLTAQLQTVGTLTSLQKDVMAKHMEATVSAVKFAGNFPAETTTSAHFCPIHKFNETHSEDICNRCKALKLSLNM